MATYILLLGAIVALFSAPIVAAPVPVPVPVSLPAHLASHPAFVTGAWRHSPADTPLALAALHTVTLALRQRNLDVLPRVLWEVSSPRSSRYARYLTHAQLADIVSVPESVEVVIEWLQQHGAQSIDIVATGDVIRAKLTADAIYRMMKVHLYAFRHIQ